jgi:hypothetical protein
MYKIIKLGVISFFETTVTQEAKEDMNNPNGIDIRGVIDGLFQAIINSVHRPETMEKCFYENDTFSDGYNIVVDKYEKYCKKDVDK